MRRLIKRFSYPPSLCPVLCERLSLLCRGVFGNLKTLFISCRVVACAIGSTLLMQSPPPSLFGSNYTKLIIFNNQKQKIAFFNIWGILFETSMEKNCRSSGGNKSAEFVDFARARKGGRGVRGRECFTLVIFSGTDIFQQ